MLRRLLIRLYLSGRGRGVSPDELKVRTLHQLRRYLSQLEMLSVEQLAFPQEKGKWNAQEITYHVMKTVRYILRVCDGLHRGIDLPPLDRSQIGRTKVVSREILLEDCRRTAEMLEKFSFHSESKRTYVHPTLGNWDFKGWLVINLVHLERHYRALKMAIGTRQ